MATINHKTYNEGTETFKDFSVYDGKDTLIFKVDGSSANVGIGTTTADAKLQVVGAFAQQIRFGTNTSVYTNLSMGTGFTTFDSIGGDSGAYSFRDDGVTRLFIDASGNVGIGTSLPDSKLNIAGGATRALRLDVNSGVQAFSVGSLGIFGLDAAGVGNGRFIITELGDVGIGKPSPSVKLDVAGVIAGNGLKFPAEQAASADVNTLDDYEEGTWTMGVQFGGASVGLTYSTQAGTYTKIGRQVTLNGRISLSAKGSSTGEARITGLPFTIANTEGNRSVPALRFANITFANQFQGFGVNNTTQILLQEITEAGADSVLTDADFANNSEIFICFTYFV